MGHFGATQVILKPAPAGTGLVASGAVSSIHELAGIKNVYSKIYGTRTQGNVVKATIDGLQQLKTYEQISETRYGKKVAADEAK
jgi:small subunit ribosomal protein S5